MTHLLQLLPAAVAALCRRQPPPVFPQPRGVMTTQWHLRTRR